MAKQIKAAALPTVPVLTRGQKAARTRKRNIRKAQRAALKAASSPITVGEPSMTDAIMRRLAAFDTSLRELTRRVMGDNEHAPIAEVVPVKVAQSPEEVKRIALIEQMTAALAALKGEPTSNDDDNDDASGLEPGSYTPQAKLMIPLLQTLASMPSGGGTTRSVLERIERRIKLAPADFDRLPTGAVRWENATMFMRQKARVQGLMRDDSPRGHWYISDKGRAFLKAQGIGPVVTR